MCNQYLTIKKTLKPIKQIEILLKAKLVLIGTPMTVQLVTKGLVGQKDRVKLSID